MQGGLRVVEIEGVDINACGGTHLASLAEIQVRAASELEFIMPRKCIPSRLTVLGKKRTNCNVVYKQ